jgi:UTP:GlnB (protein PII) uridylyltransferase
MTGLVWAIVWDLRFGLEPSMATVDDEATGASLNSLRIRCNMLKVRYHVI